MCQAAEGGDIADFVSVQSKVEQLRQAFQWRNILYPVLSQPQPLQLGKACQRRQVCNGIVVQV